MTADEPKTIFEAIALTEQVSYTLRSYYSIGWLTTADIMKTCAEEVGGGRERPDAPDYDKMRAFVLSAMTASVAFLEAHINELFDDAHTYLAEPGAKPLRGLDGEAQTRMAAEWPDIKMTRLVEKYAAALSLAGADPLDRGAEPARRAKDLLGVRNHYLHYQPDSVRDGIAEGDDKKLSVRLQSKLTLPEWDKDGTDLFPNRAICPDLARWAVESAVLYADAFCKSLGITRGYDHVRPDWLV